MRRFVHGDSGQSLSLFFLVVSFSWCLVLAMEQGVFPCLNLTRTDETHSFSGGHSRECFSDAVISFETCRLLLHRSKDCFAMSYLDQKCSLHDMSARGFQFVDTGKRDWSKIPISYVKNVFYTSSEEDCSNYSFKSALSKFDSCVGQRYSNQVMLDKLPLLGIVISVTDHWAHTHKAAIASITSNFNCYASAHNYTFILNIMEDMTAAQFFHHRHHDVLQKFLGRFQYVLHLDADSLVLNISQSLDNFLTRSRADVQLHMHENGEITAATYLLRNSQYSACFLKYWADFSPPRASNYFLAEIVPSYSDKQGYDGRLFDVPNFDNGDLVSAVMNQMDSDFFLDCMLVIAALSRNTKKSLSNVYHQTVIECWKLAISRDRNLFSDGIGHGTRIYLHKEGYWRTHSRWNRFGSNNGKWWNLLTASCYPSSDIIGHGWKGMMRTMWPIVFDKERNYYDLNHENSTKHCKNAILKSNSGANVNCNWLSVRDEFNVAKEYCNWRSPMCTTSFSRTCLNNSVIVPSQLKSPSVYRSKNAECSVCLADKDSGCYDIMCNELNISDKSVIRASVVKSIFGPAKRLWWKSQMCASCPRFDCKGRQN